MRAPAERPIPNQIADLSQLPEGLAPLMRQPRWKRWQYEFKEGRWTKRPQGKWELPANWLSHKKAAARIPPGGGVGVVLTGDCEHVAIDLDNCLREQDGGTDAPAWARSLLESAEARGAYVERTVGGSGARIIGTTARNVTIHCNMKGVEQPDGSLKIISGAPAGSPGFEIYCRPERQFMTVSGLGEGSVAVVIDAIVDELLRLYPPPERPAAAASEPGWRLYPDGGPGEIDNDDMQSITGPLLPGTNKSDRFHGVVSNLFYANHSTAEIVTLMEKHPDGVAQRYIGENRLEKMVEQSFTKFRGEFEQRKALGAAVLNRATPLQASAPGVSTPQAESASPPGVAAAPAEAGETQALKKLIEEFNSQYFVVRVAGKTLIGTFETSSVTGHEVLSLMRDRDFKLWLSNKRITLRGPKDGVKVLPLADVWLTDPRRRQYAGVDLVPGGAKVLPNGYLNLWRGWGVQPRQGAWPLLQRHVREVLAAGSQEDYEYVLKWAAWSLQHPGERAEVALVFKSGVGGGKGLFCRALARCFGAHALPISQPEHLTGKFNGHLRGCLFLFVDEAFWAGDKRATSVLKNLITEPIITLEQKGIDAVSWPNRMHIAMAANDDWVVPATEGERRYAMFDCANTYVKGRTDDATREAYFNALYQEIDNGGLEAMMHDLLNWNLGNWHPRKVPDTEGLQKQKRHSLSPKEQWFVELLEDGKLPGECPDRSCASTRALVENAMLRVPRLRNVLSESDLGTFLKDRGCVRSNHIKITAGTVNSAAAGSGRTLQARGWKFLPLGTLREDWARRYGGWSWDDPEADWQ